MLNAKWFELVANEQMEGTDHIKRYYKNAHKQCNNTECHAKTCQVLSNISRWKWAAYSAAPGRGSWQGIFSLLHKYKN